MEIVRKFCLFRNKQIREYQSEFLNKKLGNKLTFEITTPIPIYFESIPVTESFSGQFYNDQPITLSIKSDDYALKINGQIIDKNSVQVFPKSSKILKITTIKK